MNTTTEEQIGSLAQPLWESAARPYGVALDFWLMAEQMVLEVATATARMQESAIAEINASFTDPLPPSAMPVERVRELAYCMWESAGRQYGVAQDFWLAAERHVLAVVRATGIAPDIDKESLPDLALELSTLSPAAYLERVRSVAYTLWDNAGRQYGRAFETWLQAEQEVLDMMARAGHHVAPGGSDQLLR